MQGPVARSDAPHAASLALDLEPAAVGLVEGALRARSGPLAVVCRLGTEGLWPAARVTARVDWQRVYAHLSAQLTVGRVLEVDDLARLTEELREDRSIVVTAVQGLTPEQGGGPDDLAAALAWVQRELVERFCEPVLPLARGAARAGLGTTGEVLGMGTQLAVKALTQVETATASVDLQRAAVVARTWTVQAPLAELLPAADLAGDVVDAGLDHPFFARFSLGLRPAAPLADLHVAEVVGDLAYGTTHLPVRLVPDAETVELSTWADASPDRSWTLRLDARFADDAPTGPGERLSLPVLDGRERQLTVDLADGLGLRTLTLLRAVDARVLLTRVRLEHRRGDEQRAERDVVLAGDLDRTTVVLADHRPGDRVTAQVSHLLADGRMTPAAELEVDTTQVVVPPAYEAVQSVQVVGSGDWSGDGVVRAVVALQRQESDRAVTVVLDDASGVAAASLDLPDPTDRRYRYRVTRTGRGGEVVEDDWQTTDAPVLLVGGTGADLLLVDVTPVGPELPIAGVLLIEVDLSYVDAAHQVRDQQTVVIRALADRPRWRVPLADHGRRDYEYRVTTHHTSGAVTTGPWTDSTDRVLAVPVVAA